MDVVARDRTQVTVLMTAFNAGGYLSVAIQSLLRQSLSDWKLILVDNGSTDDSVSSLKLEDSRIQIFRFAANVGRTQALQFALTQSGTPFTAVLDADDVAHPNRLSQQLSSLELSDDLVLVGSHVTFLIEGDGCLPKLNEVVGTISHDQLAERNPFVHSSVMFRTSAALTSGGYDDKYPYAQDYDLFQKLALIGRCSILPSQLTGLRIHPKSITRNQTFVLQRLTDELHLSQLAADRLQLSPLGVRLNRRRQALVHLELAYNELLSGRILSGLKNLAFGVKIDPTMSWILYLLRGRPYPKALNQSLVTHQSDACGL